jgi:DNA-binding LytR/AlgR family response regulator
MKGIEEYLPQGLFIRVHRSYIVNKTNILSIRENTIDMIVGGTIKGIPVGKSFKDSLLDDINVVSR